MANPVALKNLNLGIPNASARWGSGLSASMHGLVPSINGIKASLSHSPMNPAGSAAVQENSPDASAQRPLLLLMHPEHKGKTKGALSWLSYP